MSARKLRRLSLRGRCKLDTGSESCCSKQHPDYKPPKPAVVPISPPSPGTGESPPQIDDCCTNDAPICICGSKCGTPEQLAATTCAPGPYGSCCDAQPIDPAPKIDECCTAEAPACICGSRCGTRDEAAVTEDCAPGADASCCEEELPVQECCTKENPVCICGRCGTREELARATCPDDLVTSCCDANSQPPVVEECCTKEKPVCLCGSRCGTRDALLLLKCPQFPPGACCDNKQ